jgi:hydrogenase maturation protein HypF
MFHKMLVDLFTHVAEEARKQTGISTVALSGGVFQNSFLFEHLARKLKSQGFLVLSHSKVPANDGGISFGQVAVAQSLLAQNMQKVNYS